MKPTSKERREKAAQQRQRPPRRRLRRNSERRGRGTIAPREEDPLGYRAKARGRILIDSVLKAQEDAARYFRGMSIEA